MSTTPLSDTREVVERTLFQSIRQELVDKGYLPDINAIVNSTIIGINQGIKTFTVSLDVTNLYQNGRQFNVVGSTLNNGTYTVVSSVFTSPNTIITVSQNIPSPTLNGGLNIFLYYDDTAGVAAYQAAFAPIIASKGYAIEVFGAGADWAKYQKKVPRIVIFPNQTLPGALGGNPDKIYIPVGIDPLAPTSYTAQVLPPQTVDFTYDIRLVHTTAQQSRVLHGITSLALPPRGYIPLYNDNTRTLYVEQYSYRNIPDPAQNIEEDIYMYKVGDLFESDNASVGPTIYPITNIEVDISEGTPGNSTPFNDLIITP